MKNWFVILLSILCSLIGITQNRFDTLHYISLEQALELNPLEVEAIDLSKSKLSAIPDAVFDFTALKGLKLSRNKLSILPEEMKKLTELQYVYIDKNKLTEFPIVLFYFSRLEVIALQRNKIFNLPDGIKMLQSLKYIDLWDNRIKALPSSLIEMPNLEYIDLRGITFSPTFVETWTNKMPHTQIHFEKPCACLD